MGNKKTPADSKEKAGKQFVGTYRPPKPAMGIDRSLDPDLNCQYCRDTSHELETVSGFSASWSVCA